MTYGTIKVDTVTFTDAGVDKSVTLSGLVQNPTFSGNVTVTGTLSGVTVTGTTANFTSGNFTNISGGTHTITSGVFAAGSAASPSITFTGDLNTGIYSPGADQVAISTGGSGRLFVDASGRVGVGSAPSVGNGIHATINTNNYGTALVLQNANVNGWAAEMQFLGITTTDTQAKIGALATGPGSNSGALAFYTANAGSYLERLRITSAGLVGVGTSSPSYVLDVAGSARVKTGATGTPFIVSTGSDSQGSIRFGSSGGVGVYGIYGGADYTGLQFWTGGVQALTIDNSQRVGIGTTSPSQLLHIQGASNPAFLSLDTRNNVNAYMFAGNTEAVFGAGSAHPVTFRVTDLERARIDTSGRLLVGTSSARSNFFNTSASAALQVEGASGDTRRLSIVSSATGNAPAVLILGRQTSGSIGGNTSVANDSSVGWISFQGNDGAEFVEAASIECYADGTPGANDMPGRLVFSTTADGASSPTERLRITSAGLVGIGTSSPQSAVDVLSGVRGVPETSGSTTSVTTLRIRGSSNGVLDIGELSSATAGSYWLQVRDRTDLGFAYNLALQPNGGSVGIGTTSPSATLQVSPSSGSANFQVSRGSKGLQINQDNDSADPNINTIGATALRFLRDGGESMRIDTSGRLLVGTSSALTNVRYLAASYTPQYQFSGTNQTNTMFSLTRTDGVFGPIQFFNTGSSGSVPSSGTNLGIISFNGYDGTNYIQAASIEAKADAATGANDMPGRLVFSTTADGASSPTERMRISSAGATNVFTSGGGFVVDSSLAAGTTEYLFAGNYGVTSLGVGGTTSFYVRTNGNVQNTNNSYGAISDIKLKENIVDANSQWDDIKALQVRKYNFKQETGHQTHTQIGLVAQEVELVSPGLVSESPDRDAEGNDLGTVTKSVNYSVLYMKAVKALQEAMERIEQLEAKVSVLESKP